MIGDWPFLYRQCLICPVWVFARRSNESQKEYQVVQSEDNTSSVTAYRMVDGTRSKVNAVCLIPSDIEFTVLFPLPFGSPERRKEYSRISVAVKRRGRGRSTDQTSGHRLHCQVSKAMLLSDSIDYTSSLYSIISVSDRSSKGRCSKLHLRAIIPARV